MRFIAAIWVLAFHFAGGMHWSGVRNVWAGYGSLGVALFFILSGFVLGYNYFPLMAEGRFVARDFWVARFARIYPVYLLAFVLTGFWMVSQLRHGLLAASTFSASGVTSIFLVQAWTTWSSTWNPVGWTLSVEAFLYAVFPLAAGIARLRQRGALAALLLAAAAAVVGTGFWRSEGIIVPLLFLGLFVEGMVLARLHTLLEAGRRWPRMPTLWSLAAIAIFSLPGLGDWTVSLVVTVGFGGIIFALAAGRGLIARLLGWKPFQIAGDASYALYILQYSFWTVLLVVWHHHAAVNLPSLPDDSPTVTVIYFCWAIAASIAVHYWFESPIRKIIRRRWMASPAAKTIAAAAGRS